MFILNKLLWKDDDIKNLWQRCRRRPRKLVQCYHLLVSLAWRRRSSCALRQIWNKLWSSYTPTGTNTHQTSLSQWGKRFIELVPPQNNNQATLCRLLCLLFFNEERTKRVLFHRISLYRTHILFYIEKYVCAVIVGEREERNTTKKFKSLVIAVGSYTSRQSIKHFLPFTRNEFSFLFKSDFKKTTFSCFYVEFLIEMKTIV